MLKQENKRDKLVKEVVIALKEKYSYENIKGSKKNISNKTTKKAK